MPRNAKAVGRWVRCSAALTVQTTGVDPVVEHLWPGLVVNLDRELRPGVTLGDAVGGRTDCFVAVSGPDDQPDAPQE